MVKKKDILTLEIKYLEKIAEYYEFPFAIFLGDEKVFSQKHKTRLSFLRKKAEKYDKIVKVVNNER